MTSLSICVVPAAIIYVIYNFLSVCFFGIPNSLSMTYYLYKERWNTGYVFPLVMYLIIAFMLPSWITISEGSNFQFLSFLAPACIAFVATAPAFKSSNLENAVHSVSAILAAICSIAWICIVTPYWQICIVWFIFVALLSVFTSSYKTATVYWLETIAFGSTFTTIIMYSL